MTTTGRRSPAAYPAPLQGTAIYTRAMGDDDAAARLRAACELFDVGVALRQARLRRENPDLSDDEIEAAIVRWLHDRPGAEFGDYPGPPSTRRISVEGK